MARHTHHRAFDPISAGECTQVVGRLALIRGIVNRPGVTSADCAVVIHSGEVAGHREPPRDTGVWTVLSHHLARIERRERVGVAAEQSGNGLLPEPDIREQVTVDVDEPAEQFRVLDSQGHRAGTAHRNADNAPIRRVSTGAEVRTHIWHNIFGQVIRGVAAHAVHALGVIAESAGRVDEHQHRCISAVLGREVVDGLLRVTDTEPVLGCAELGADHHHHRQSRRRIAGVPRRRQIHEFAAVRKMRRIIGGRHRDDGALQGLVAMPAHRCDRRLVGLAG